MKTSQFADLYLRRLYLRDFRNYSEEQVEFDPGFNSIHGANAQGKTNLLEALFLFVSGRSFRSKQLSELIRYGADAFYLELHFRRRGLDQVLSMSCDGRARRMSHNRTLLTSLKDLLGVIPGVLSSPDDGALIKGAPATRRHFLDLQLSQADPLYLHHLSRYSRALKQRNHQLRQKCLDGIEIWEGEMAVSGAYLVQERRLVVEDLNSRCAEVHATLAETPGDLSLHYRGALAEVEELKRQYAVQREREMMLGNTLSGPHRDDLQISIDGREVRAFASEGQQRSCLAALRLGEWLRLRERSGDTPLMLIDDVANSLDASRRERLFSALSGQGQVCVTSPERVRGSGLLVEAGRVSAGALNEA